MRKSLWIILCVLVVTIAVPNAHADAVSCPSANTCDVTVNGTTYSITTETISANSLTEFLSLLPGTPWMGNFALADALTTALGPSLGVGSGLDQGTAPAFVWGAFYFPLGQTSSFEVDYFFFAPPAASGVLEEPVVSSLDDFKVAVPAAEPGTPSLLFAGLLGLGLVFAVKRYRGGRLATEA